MSAGKIYIVGDLMIDNNHHCSCNRIAPEAPLPVYKLINSDYVLGGCGNVAVNVHKLYSNVSLLSVIGDDDWAAKCKHKIKEFGIIDDTIISKNRPTTVKTRQFVCNKLVNRLDSEVSTNIDKHTEDLIINKIKNDSDVISGIIFSDYNKGVLTHRVVRDIIDYANANNIPTFVDPKNNFNKYEGCFLIKPNKIEASGLLGYEIDKTNLNVSLQKISNIVKSKYVLVTMSENGMVLYNSQSHTYDNLCSQYISKSDVVDVTGAGDMVLSIVSYFTTIHDNILKGCEIANKLCQYAVTKPGTCAINAALMKFLNNKPCLKYMYDTTENISFLTDELQGKTIIFTNGCFDVVHPGHVEYLDKAKEHGDVLIVGLNSDKSVQRLKGLNRPINNEIARAKVLLGLKSVDYVIIFNDNTPLELIKKIEPSVLIKGGDYDPEEKNTDSSKYIVGKNYAESTKVITFVDGHSTTNTINNILNKNSATISTTIA